MPSKKEKNRLKGKKSKNLYTGPEYESITQFVKVELASNGVLTLCRATTVDGCAEHFVWDNPKHRDLVRNNCIKDVEIIEGPNLGKGWNYGI